MKATGIIWILGYLGLVIADWQFRSRPDLAPPRLNITIPATDAVEKGYIFVAPFQGYQDSWQHGPRQAGPYIFRDNGDLVWSGYSIFSIWAANFQASRWKGTDVLFTFEGDHNPGYGHGHGHITFLDSHYDTIREIRAGNHKISDKHEFHIVNEKTGLLQVYQPVPRDLAEFGGSSEQQWIVNAIFQELDIESGRLLFEWASLDHISPHESVLPLNPGQAGSGYNSSDAWDYFHINSVDKDGTGNYLLSARDACSVVKVNGTDGTVIWRLAGKNSSFSLGPGADFCFQHHARCLTHNEGAAIELISLYDNSAHGTEHGGGHEVHTAPTSSGKILRLDTTSWEAELVQGFYPPDDLLSKSQGSTQVLPNGNVIVGWGSEGAVTEFKNDGTPIFHAYLDSGRLGDGVENYRAFRFNWTGLPHEDPAIVALQGEGSTEIYVSWNGDTETAVWRFFEVGPRGGDFEPRQVLGEVKRTSFETRLQVDGDVQHIEADALDERGHVLRSTGVAQAEPKVLPAGTPCVALGTPSTTSKTDRSLYEKVLAKVERPRASFQFIDFFKLRWLNVISDL